MMEYGVALSSEAVAARGAETKRWLLIMAKAAFNGRRRANFYRFLASYIERSYRLDDALTSIYLEDTDHDTKKARSVIGVGIPSILAKMKMDGVPFARALEGWAPAGELLALQAFEEGGLSAETLRYLADSIRSSDATAREIKKVFIRLGYTFAGVQAIAFGLAYFIMPKIFKTIPVRVVTPGMEEFRAVFEWVAVYGPFIGVASALLVIWVWWSLSRLTGPVREHLDSYPVYATYREWQGSIWLRSLAALVAVPMPVTKAMALLSNGGTPYLNWQVSEIVAHLSGNLAQAMKATGRQWPSAEMITALGILLSGHNPEKALQLYADEWLQDGQIRIVESLGKIKTLSYIVAAIAGLWFYHNVNEIILAYTNL